MPVATTFYAAQPTPNSIVEQPVVWTPMVWTAVQCTNPPPNGSPETFTVTVTSFSPNIAPAAYNGDPGLVIDLTAVGTNATSAQYVNGIGTAVASVTFPGTITMTVSGKYTEYLFPNKEYRYRNDAGVVHEATTTTSDSGYVATEGTLNQDTALTFTVYLNPETGDPIAGVPGTGMIAEIPTPEHMQYYIPDPQYVITVTYTIVITSSCVPPVGAGTFTTTQGVYDDKDIATQRFVDKIASQTNQGGL